MEEENYVAEKSSDNEWYKLNGDGHVSIPKYSTLNGGTKPSWGTSTESNYFRQKIMCCRDISTTEIDTPSTAEILNAVPTATLIESSPRYHVPDCFTQEEVKTSAALGVPKVAVFKHKYHLGEKFYLNNRPIESRGEDFETQLLKQVRK